MLGLYVASVLLMFLLFAFEVGPYGAALMTDAYMVRGLATRLLHPMTTDKQMIANFQAKRADFEKIIQLNNEICLKETAYAKRDYQESMEIGRLLNNLKLISLSSTGKTLWFSEPYSAEAKKKQDALKREYQTSSYSDAVRVKMCKYSAMEFVWERSPTLSIYKGLTYFPEEPILKDGKIIEPVDFFNPSPYNPRNEKGIVDILFGEIFIDFDNCKYQKIDRNWFIFTCG